ncbi:tetratricopeptide repeat protein [Candidatus Latescibacterota bacterium]
MNNQTKSSTIMFTVIDRYPALVTEDKQKARRLIEKARDIIKPLIKQYNGEWHKDTLSSFSSPGDAVNCALEIQKTLKDDAELNLRIGIHVGDMVFGEADGVKVASGIGPLAEPGGVCISDQVYYAIRNKPDLEAEFLGEKTLENVNRPIKVYALKIGKESEPSTKFSETRKKPSIAVLPFVNMSADPEQEYFCVGIAEEIINALTHIENLNVVSLTSALVFKDKHEDIREIGRKLDVNTLLEGSVRKAGNRLRITSQLINVADGYHIWSERFDREMEDVFAIQDEISLAIVKELKVKLLGGDKARVIKRHTDNLEAYNLYIKGRWCWNRRQEGGLKKALEYFRQAIEKDPLYAFPHVGIADTFIVLGFNSILRPDEAFLKVKTAAKRALEIDNMLGEAYSSLACISLFYYKNWIAAENEFNRAIELNPSHASVHEFYALNLVAIERFDEAITEIKRAQELDPVSLIINAVVGFIFMCARQNDKALESVQIAIEMDPNFYYSYLFLGQIYVGMERWEEAIEAFQKLMTLSGGSSFTLGYLGMAYGLSGQKDKALKTLDQLNDMAKESYVSPYHQALIYMGLGDNDQALEYLEKAYLERESHIIFMKVWSVFDSLRSDPRFKSLLKKMGLE